MGAVRYTIDLLARGWLWISLILTPIVAHAGGLGFQAVAFFMGIGGALILLFNWKESVYFKQAWIPIFIGFTLWAWFTTLWSPYQADDALGNGLILFVFALTLILMPLVFMRLSDKQKRFASHLFMAGTVLAAGIMLFDVLSGFALSIFFDPVKADSNIYVRQGEAERAIGRGLMSYSHLIWPAAILMLTTLKRGWVLVGVVFLAFGLTAILDRLTLTIPTLIVTASFVAIAWYKPRLGLQLAIAIAISSLVFAPIIGILSSHLDEATLSKLPLSWEHRVRMWAYVWEQIQLNWLFGNGFDASRTYQDTFQARDGRDIVIVSLHPHNIGLQIWLEVGFVGVALISGFFVATLKPLIKFCHISARSAAMAGIIVATTINGALTIGVWQYWWWGLIALSICIVSVISHKKEA